VQIWSADGIRCSSSNLTVRNTIGVAVSRRGRESGAPSGPPPSSRNIKRVPPPRVRSPSVAVDARRSPLTEDAVLEAKIGDFPAAVLTT